MGMSNSIVRRGLTQIEALLGAVTPADVGRPTPCSEWTVSDLGDHVVNSVAGMAIMARGGQPDWSTTTHHDDPAAALHREGVALVEALEVESGSFPAGMAAAELAVHAYDLAVSLGRGTLDLDPEIAETGLEFMSASMTDDMRGSAFGPRQPAPDDADAYQRIAAFAGRVV
jgi:uncharacterized protein (TIGR03086 family)